jgi:hypothetical protein
MSTRKAILTAILTLSALALNTTFAGAHVTREFTGTIGSSFAGTLGLAVDLETGNVYVADVNTDTVYIYGATGGSPAGGAPSEITGLKFEQTVDGLGGVAVDNSCYEQQPRLTGEACEKFDPLYGDVFVTSDAARDEGVEVFKLDSEGKYEMVETFYDYLKQPKGVALDSLGDVYIANYFSSNPNKGAVVERKVSGEEVEIPPENIVEYPGYVAVGAPGDVYVGEFLEFGQEEDRGVAKLKVGIAGEILSEEVLAAPIPGTHRPVALDSATGNLYVGDGSHVAEYDAAGALQLEFGSREPNGGSLIGLEAVPDVAVNSETGRVYVANTSGGDVDVFSSVIGPPVVAAGQPAASDLARTSALVAGTVNPESGSATYHFEYAPAAEYAPGSAEPYAGVQSAVNPLTGGHTPETIERVLLSGLRPGTSYDYRIVATNAAGTTDGPNETFTTAAATPPVASTGAASEVGETSATLTGVVSPRGLPTSYVFEVGTDTSYGGAKLFGNAGSSTGEVPVTVALQYLVPGVTYHYRLIATSFDGTSYGQDGTFTTPGIPATVVQPASAPLIATLTVQFPSVAGAITEPQGPSKTRKAKRKRTKRKSKHAAGGRAKGKTMRRRGR